jgi:hypothetical protein
VFNSKFEVAEKRIWELEDRLDEITYFGNKNEKHLINEQNFIECETV